MAINPGSNINNTFDSLYNNKSSGKEERKKRQFKFILHQLELRINIYIYIYTRRAVGGHKFPINSYWTGAKFVATNRSKCPDTYER